MKTIVIWNDVENEIGFFVVNKDISHLNKIYINSIDSPEDLQDELNSIVFLPDDEQSTGSYYKVEMLDEFPMNIVTGHNACKVITAGFIP